MCSHDFPMILKCLGVGWAMAIDHGLRPRAMAQHPICLGVLGNHRQINRKSIPKSWSIIGKIMLLVMFELFLREVCERIAQKLRRIILFQFGLVTFRFHLEKLEHLTFSRFSNLGTCP